VNEAVAETLAGLLSAEGAALASSERRLEGFLRDLHPDAPLEVSVLVEAVTRGVVARLLASEGWPMGAARESLVAALTEGSGLALRPAEWAVAVWCRSLLGDAAEGGGRGARWRASRVSERHGTLQEVLGRAEEAQR
jgi:hypothetical protein